jgi:hypothetical protein
MGDVADAMRTAFNGLTVHEQAFANLPSQIATQATAAATTVVQNISSENVSNVVTHFNLQTGPVVFFPGLGAVHNLIGQTSYSTQQSDAGMVLLFADSSPIALSLSPVTPPWFCWVSNTGNSTITITPDSGSVNNYPSVALPDSSWATFFADATQNFWALGVA